MDNAVPKPTSLDFLRAVYLNNELPLSVRMRAAGLAIPYELPKLSVVANIANADLGDRLERAIARSAESPGSTGNQSITEYQLSSSTNAATTKTTAK